MVFCLVGCGFFPVVDFLFMCFVLWVFFGGFVCVCCLWVCLFVLGFRDCFVHLGFWCLLVCCHLLLLQINLTKFL